jgi:hypothetical protein
MVWLLPVDHADAALPGHTTLSMLVALRARRDWTPGGHPNQQEIQSFVDDALTAITAALRARHAVPADGGPELLPVGPHKAGAIAERAGDGARAWTTSPHPSLTGDAPDEGAGEDDEPPYRVVDRDNQGWHATSGVLYSADFGEARGLTDLEYRELDQQRGPLRTVVPSDPGDDLLITSALTDAGVKAAASVLVALYQVSLEYAQASRVPGQRDGGTLMAGREGSWETHAMNLLAWEVGSDLADKPGRYDADCVRVLAEVLRLWTGQADVYVEVAENLAFLFSRVAHERGGWEKVADRYLRPGTRVGHPEHVVEQIRGYLLSKAERAD